MKLTVRQLKQLIKEQVEEMSTRDENTAMAGEGFDIVQDKEGMAFAKKLEALISGEGAELASQGKLSNVLGDDDFKLLAQIIRKAKARGGQARRSPESFKAGAEKGKKTKQWNKDHAHDNDDFIHQILAAKGYGRFDAK